jgi:hypothetical protein
MRNLFLTAVASLVLVPASWAQDKDAKSNVSDAMTVRGTVAGITIEGETAIDLRTNTAMTVERAFLTIVGSPTRKDDSKSGSDRARDNVYLVWLTPRTKVCERTMDTAKLDATDKDATDKNKKEVALDQLEVGDRVEIEFNRGEESGANAVSPKTEQMRRRHGRHRTFSGYATSLTIIPQTQADKDREREREDNPSTTDKSR